MGLGQHGLLSPSQKTPHPNRLGQAGINPEIFHIPHACPTPTPQPLGRPDLPHKLCLAQGNSKQGVQKRWLATMKGRGSNSSDPGDNDPEGKRRSAGGVVELEGVSIAAKMPTGVRNRLIFQLPNNVPCSPFHHLAWIRSLHGSSAQSKALQLTKLKAILLILEIRSQTTCTGQMGTRGAEIPPPSPPGRDLFTLSWQAAWPHV